MSRLDGDPSGSECGAPCNEEVGEDGQIYCGCTTCRTARRRALREEETADQLENDERRGQYGD